MTTGRLVLAHGSGSTAEFARRAVGSAFAAAGWTVDVVEDRTGSVAAVADALTAAVRRGAPARSGPTVVGGISLGAHAAVRCAHTLQAHRVDQGNLQAESDISSAFLLDQRAQGPVDGLVLVLPAWTGAPGVVADLSAHAAARVRAVGTAATLAEVDDKSWVAAELALAWPAYGPGLATALEATAASPGPGAADLAAVNLPVAIVGLRDDPFHPVDVAERWAALLPNAALVVLEQAEVAARREALGDAAMTAWLRATQATGQPGRGVGPTG